MFVKEILTSSLQLQKLKEKTLKSELFTRLQNSVLRTHNILVFHLLSFSKRDYWHF